MTTDISVEENIKVLNEQLEQLYINKKNIENQILRMEGSRLVFEDFLKIGVTIIPMNNQGG
jgi:hypothetical protein